MNNEYAKILMEELQSPIKYNINPVEIDVEKLIKNREIKSEWLIEFESICNRRQIKNSYKKSLWLKLKRKWGR